MIRAGLRTLVSTLMFEKQKYADCRREKARPRRKLESILHFAAKEVRLLDGSWFHAKPYFIRGRRRDSYTYKKYARNSVTFQGIA